MQDVSRVALLERLSFCPTIPIVAGKRRPSLGVTCPLISFELGTLYHESLHSSTRLRRLFYMAEHCHGGPWQDECRCVSCRRHGRHGHVGPVLDRRFGQPQALPTERVLPHAWHEASGGPGNQVQQLLRDERLLADAKLDHDRANAARHGATNWINPEKDNRGPMGPPDWNWRGLRKTDVTLPRVLQSAGYQTIHVGKAHFGPTEAPGGEPLNLGFDINVAGCAIGAPATYYGKQNYGNGQKRRVNRAVPHLEKYHGTDTFLSEALTLEAKRHVTDAVKADKPFYLYMAHYAVHAPFNSDPRFADNYKDSGKKANAQAFATLIEGMDKSLDDTLDYLDELGVAEDTLVLFLGDNGSDAPLGHEHAVACAAPLRGKKGSHYEGGMRVPFIAAWAKPNADSQRQKQLPIPHGVIQPQIGNVTDLMPTILQVTGVSAPSGHTVDGAPLQKLLAGNSDPSRKSQFLMHYPHAPHRSTYFSVLRDGNWKVIYHYYPSEDSEGERYQLYNLANDPFEQSNLADSHPKELAAMMKKLAEQLDAHEARYPVTKDQSDQVKPVMPELAKR